MEYTQWVQQLEQEEDNTTRLNPCCNGIYSMRVHNFKEMKEIKVLILVVMEYTQWDSNRDATEVELES